jgi:LPXTG-motif cell wall-anchored protein
VKAISAIETTDDCGRCTERVALTVEECAELIEKGELARDDLAKLLEAVEEDPSIAEGGGDGGDGGFDVGAYVEQLTEDAAINIFGFVPPVVAGAPLDVCLPGGTTTLVLDGTIVLWEGLATTDPFPVTVLIPGGIECSEHTMTAIGTDPETGEPFERTVTFLVVGDCSTGGPGTPPLPVTGAQAGKMAIIAIGLVVLGGAALFGSRRRSAVTS